MYFSYEMQFNTQTLLSANDHFATLLTGCQRHNAIFQVAENIKNPYSTAAPHDVRPP